MTIFEKVDYWGLKDPLEVWVHYETCSTICGIPVPAILNHKISTGSAGGAKNSQNGVFLEVQKYPPPANPVEFLWFKMAGTGIPHIVLCFMLDSHL